MRKKLQIFVSSTFKDLLEERQAAVEAILNAGQIPAGMELFKAGNESQLETIKRWIDESDIYLLILGGRYGSIEPTSGRSYTHLEYEYALEKGIPVFALVISDTALSLKVDKLKQDAFELDNQTLYREFKGFVLSKICRFFDDLKDIKIAIHETLADFQQRYTFTGWLSGNELPNVEKLSIENAELKAQIAMLQKEIMTPDIDLELIRRKGLNEELGHFSLYPLILNKGNASAKYFTCICSIVEGDFEIQQSDFSWTISENRKSCQYTTGANMVIYPVIPTDPGYIEFKPTTKNGNTKLILKFMVIADNMLPKQIIKEWETNEIQQTKISID